jgi:hypothetical protein
MTDERRTPEERWELQLAEASKLPDAELARHARVSLTHRCRCRQCFCCACVVEAVSRRTNGQGEAKYIELWLTPAEARRVLALLDADHESNPRSDDLSKSAGKKIWQHLADLGLVLPGRGIA